MRYNGKSQRLLLTDHRKLEDEVKVGGKEVNSNTNGCRGTRRSDGKLRRSMVVGALWAGETCKLIAGGR